MNSYEYIKIIAEEFRAIAVINNVPVITGTQVNRDGFTDSDPGIEHTAESWGLPATADYMWIIITNDELKRMNRVMFKQGKNRYGDANDPSKFMIGRDINKMRLFNVTGDEQTQVDQPIFDKSDMSLKALKEKFKSFT